MTRRRRRAYFALRHLARFSGRNLVRLGFGSNRVGSQGVGSRREAVVTVGEMQTYKYACTQNYQGTGQEPLWSGALLWRHHSCGPGIVALFHDFTGSLAAPFSPMLPGRFASVIVHGPNWTKLGLPLASMNAFSRPTCRFHWPSMVRPDRFVNGIRQVIHGSAVDGDAGIANDQSSKHPAISMLSKFVQRWDSAGRKTVLFCVGVGGLGLLCAGFCASRAASIALQFFENLVRAFRILV